MVLDNFSKNEQVDVRIIKMLSNYTLFHEIVQNHTVITLAKPPVSSIVNGDFFTRFNSIQSWFLRVASQVKLRFLMGMFDHIKDRELMPHWFSVLKKERFDKLIGYGDMLTKAHLPNDKLLNDDNRALEDDEVEKTFINDLEWFKHYDEDFQEGIFLALISMSGGAIIRNVCTYMTEYYKSGMFDPESRTKLAEKSKSLQTKSKLSDDLNPNIACDAQVIQKGVEWRKLMENYAEEIGVNQEKRVEANKPKKKKEKKVKKKGKKGKDDATIDFIQTMPIWIVLKIFNYLDKKTLKKVSNVNSYWAYAAQCLNKEKAERIALNKLIRKMEQDIDMNAISSHKNEGQCKKKDKFARLEREGTVHRKIKEKLKVPEPRCYSSIVQDAVNLMPMEYIVPLENLKVFGRKIPDDKQKYSVYKYPPCVIYEGGERNKVHPSQLPTAGNIDAQFTANIHDTKESVRDEENVSEVFTPTYDLLNFN